MPNPISKRRYKIHQILINHKEVRPSNDESEKSSDEESEKSNDKKSQRSSGKESRSTSVASEENVEEINEIEDKKREKETDQQIEHSRQNDPLAEADIYDDYTAAGLLMGKINIMVPSQVRLVRIFTSSTFTGEMQYTRILRETVCIATIYT